MLETIVEISDALEIPLRELFPVERFDGAVSLCRLKAEAEAMSLLRELCDVPMKKL